MTNKTAALKYHQLPPLAALIASFSATIDPLTSFGSAGSAKPASFVLWSDLTSPLVALGEAFGLDALGVADSWPIVTAECGDAAAV